MKYNITVIHAITVSVGSGRRRWYCGLLKYILSLCRANCLYVCL